MSGPWPYLIALPVAYLLGAIPIGVLAGKLSRGIDVRRYGSGGTGATNVLRTLGVPTALPVLILDGGKGALAVLIAGWVGGSDIVVALAALTVVAGHSWPVFVGFKGGKSVITALGAMAVVNPIAGACALVGVLVAAITRYVSVGSVVGAFASLVCVLVLVALGSMSPLYLVFGLGGFAVIVFRHWENMARVARGEENRIGRPSRPRRARRTAAPAESPR